MELSLLSMTNLKERDWTPALVKKFLDPPDATLERITVNYIRHHLTTYDKHLEEVAGRIGGSQAIGIIRSRVYDEMAARYPEYAEECKRQMRVRQREREAS